MAVNCTHFFLQVINVKIVFVIFNLDKSCKTEKRKDTWKTFHMNRGASWGSSKTKTAALEK